ncbi:CheY-like chemotaxis protein [Azospirillum lipoferum]|uniref:Response regulator n=1 Tax=Azospirillum lipoferum TaxID=193 RepID=A0A5A9GK97_AZOLI|nr:MULTISPECIES: response regulator [Azospirillum]KAA0594104.1 response regulator [Azospirillum lipoferum]MCP1612597.1 CheY-like chemotaxis protein [Azospirillum lipoferum]MDW5531620.1 response regulator [Azospirillum sp. NL1]
MNGDNLHHAPGGRVTAFAPEALARMLSVSSAALAQGRGIALDVSVLTGTPPRLLGDAETAGALCNALTASAIATADPGRLAIRLSALPAGEERVTLRTELSGRFDTTGEDGFGQELARRLLAALGAQMSVEHGADGMRRAILDLPVALPSRTTDAERLMSWARSRGGRLLVVDDSATNRMVVAGLLAKAGFSVETATGGAEAVEAVAQAPVPPEAVLMDVAMPDMDGVAATTTIRSLGDERARIPIIAVTANAQPEDRLRCLSAGMNDYLTKPVRRADLLGALERWLAP